MSEWLPIDSAPKDGTEVLVASPTSVKICWWHTDQYAKKPKPFWAWRGCAFTEARKFAPTHWQPLLAPPSDHIDAQAGGIGIK